MRVDSRRSFMDVHMVDAENVPFLCGKNVLTECNTTIYVGKNEISFEFGGSSREYELHETSSGHMAVKLYKTGQYDTEETVLFVKKRKGFYIILSCKKGSRSYQPQI